MRYAEQNRQLDNQIEKLRARTSYDLNAQGEIDRLQRLKEENLQSMREPMGQQEYEDYDDYDQYVGAEQPEEPTLKQKLQESVIDAIGHGAQGVTLGWSDEMMGAIGGASTVAANGILRAVGHSVNGESFADAWKRGCEEYRDSAREELEKGYDRSPTISQVMEVVGGLATPIKPFRGIAGAIANGIIGGAGMTDENTPSEYLTNIGLNTAGSVIGEKLGAKAGSVIGEKIGRKIGGSWGEKAKNLSFGVTKGGTKSLARSGKPVSAAVKAGASGMTNHINNRRKMNGGVERESEENTKSYNR